MAPSASAQIPSGAIQRLRSDWTRHDPVAEAGTLRCDSQRELRKLKRINLGDSLAQRTAARCIRELAADIDDLDHRIHALDIEIADLLADVGNPLEDLHGAGTNLTATIIAQAVTSAASATPAPSPGVRCQPNSIALPVNRAVEHPGPEQDERNLAPGTMSN